jgi:hypothetical protein
MGIEERATAAGAALSPVDQETWSDVVGGVVVTHGDEADWAVAAPALRQAAIDAGFTESVVTDLLAAMEPEAEEPVEESEADWQAFLAANGPMWNGEESSWTQFSEWFAYQATESGVGQLAAAFLAYVRPLPDKVATFAEYGVVIARPGQAVETEPEPVSVSAYPTVKEGDSGEWVEYLDTMLRTNGY